MTVSGGIKEADCIDLVPPRDRGGVELEFDARNLQQRENRQSLHGERRSGNNREFLQRTGAAADLDADDGTGIEAVVNLQFGSKTGLS